MSEKSRARYGALTTDIFATSDDSIERLVSGLCVPTSTNATACDL
jgi:hypothetical protein